MEKKICIGFCQDSNEEGSIQITADVFGLIEMHNTFKSLANGLDCFNFSDLRLLDCKSSIKLFAFSDIMNVGLKPTANGTYEWRETREKWNEFSDQLLLMCYPISANNIQLESGAAENGTLQVAFSFDEYDQF